MGKKTLESANRAESHSLRDVIIIL